MGVLEGVVVAAAVRVEEEAAAAAVLGVVEEVGVVAVLGVVEEVGVVPVLGVAVGQVELQLATAVGAKRKFPFTALHRGVLHTYMSRPREVNESTMACVGLGKKLGNPPSTTLAEGRPNGEKISAE